MGFKPSVSRERAVRGGPQAWIVLSRKNRHLLCGTSGSDLVSSSEESCELLYRIRTLHLRKAQPVVLGFPRGGVGVGSWIAAGAPVQLQQVYNEAMARIRAGQSPFAAQEGVKRVTLNNADYTNRRGGPTGPFAPSTTWINGPNARPTYAPGSLEWFEQQKASRMSFDTAGSPMYQVKSKTDRSITRIILFKSLCCKLATSIFFMSGVFINKYISKICYEALLCNLDINHVRLGIDVTKDGDYKFKFDLILDRNTF